MSATGGHRKSDLDRLILTVGRCTRGGGSEQNDKPAAFSTPRWPRRAERVRTDRRAGSTTSVAPASGRSTRTGGVRVVGKGRRQKAVSVLDNARRSAHPGSITGSVNQSRANGTEYREVEK